VIEVGFAVIEAVWVAVGVGVGVGFGLVVAAGVAVDVGVTAAVGVAVGAVVGAGVLLANGAVDVGLLAKMVTVKIAEAATSDVLFFLPPAFVEPPLDVPLAWT
jgi:hypothetical protein